MPLVLQPITKASEIDKNAVCELAKALNCEELLARIMYNRGYRTYEECRDFLFSDAIFDAFSLKGVNEACAEIKAAVAAGDKIAIYGDYDVDGICACVIMKKTLERLGADAVIHIPDRHGEGYGLNSNAVSALEADGIKLIITVDCGITSADIIDRAKAKFIVTDHHICEDKLPACTVIKAGQAGDEYKNKDLCGAGTAFKLAQALTGEAANDLIDLAAVATVADVVSLTGENRSLVRRGIAQMNQTQRTGLAALVECAGIKEITSQTIAFGIAPRLNAAGRMGSAYDALNLLLEDDSDKAKESAKLLCAKNALRQSCEKAIFAEAEILAERAIRESRIIIAAKAGWEDGVVGICAARMTEKFHRPCIIFSIGDDNIAKGSGRSVAGVDLFRALSSCKDLFIKFGGHKAAAGMSIDASRLPELEARLNEFLCENYNGKLFYPTVTYDACAKAEEITFSFCHRLERLQPTGFGNREVTVRLDGVKISGIKRIGTTGEHLRFFVDDGSEILSAVTFGYKKHECDYFNLQTGVLVAHPEINKWNEQETVSLRTVNCCEKEVLPGIDFELRCAMEISRAAYAHNNEKRVEWLDDEEDMRYCAYEHIEEEVFGTLILCDDEERTGALKKMIVSELPRCGIFFGAPANIDNGYNALVIGADIEEINLLRYSHIIIADAFNEGWAEYVARKAPHANVYALKENEQAVFKRIGAQYNFSRESMAKAYMAIKSYPTADSGLRNQLLYLKDKSGLSLPLLSAAVAVFSELGFISRQNGFVINETSQKRNLEESKIYRRICGIGG